MNKPGAQQIKATKSSENLYAEGDEVRQAFNLMDMTGKGLIDPAELKNAMDSLGFKEKNPIFYDLITFFDTEEYAKKGGVDFPTFEREYRMRLEDRTSKEGLKRLFQLYLASPGAKTITSAGLSGVARELGESISKESIEEFIKQNASNETEITFDDFYALMKK